MLYYIKLITLTNTEVVTINCCDYSYCLLFPVVLDPEVLTKTFRCKVERRENSDAIYDLAINRWSKCENNCVTRKDEAP